MKTIKEGRTLQKLERSYSERERLRQEQELEAPTCDSAYDYAVHEDEDQLLQEVDVSDLFSRLPANGFSNHRPECVSDLLQTLEQDENIHPSYDQPYQQSKIYSRPGVDSKQRIKDFAAAFDAALHSARNNLYTEDESLSATSTFFPSASSIAAKFHLDDDQQAAFFTIASQVLDRECFRRKLTDQEPNQMIMYLGGEGGTGKSAVLNALTSYMIGLGVRSKLRIGAPTGVAASNIGGSTIHSLLGLNERKRNGKGPQPTSEKVVDHFKDVTMFFVDEISMSGSRVLQALATKLTDAKSEQKPFGGIDMILTGDFYQLPPISNDALYKCNSQTNITQQQQGMAKFQLCTHVVVLRTQHRMRDEEYKAFVTRFRHGEQNKNGFDDEAYLQRHVISADNSLRKGHLSRLSREPTIIVTSNKKRYHLNMFKATQHAARLGVKMLFNVARDKSSKTPLNNATRLALLLRHECDKTGYGAGLLPMFNSMPVMIKSNLGTELGISNGSTGIIHDIVLDSRENIDYNSSKPHYLRYQPVAVYIKLDTKMDQETKEHEVKFHLDGLPPNVFQLSTTVKSKTKQYPMTLKGIQFPHLPAPVQGTRSQFCFLPAYSITVNSSQGRTMEGAIIHLDGNFKHNAKPYVMLSRLTNGAMMGVLGTWQRSLWSLCPDPIMLQFLQNKIYAWERASRQPVTNLLGNIVVQEQNLRTLYRA